MNITLNSSMELLFYQIVFLEFSEIKQNNKKKLVVTACNQSEKL